MSTDDLLPEVSDVADILGVLLGKTVNAKKIPPAAPADPWAAVAAYKSAEGTVAVCRCDLPMAVFAGAGLSMIPSSRAEECVRTKDVDGTLLENLQEVMNVASRFFNRSGGAHLKLDAVRVVPTTPLPADVQAILTHAGHRLDLEIGIQDYGKGRMTLLVR